MGQPAAYQGLTTDCILSICTYSILVLYCSDQYAGEPGELLKCQVTQPHYVGVRIPPPPGEGAVLEGHLAASCTVYGICSVSPAKMDE